VLSSTCAVVQVVQACIDDGLLLVPAGPKVVRFVPPLVVRLPQYHGCRAGEGWDPLWQEEDWDHGDESDDENA
jgi:hypothetical protein